MSNKRYSNKGVNAASKAQEAAAAQEKAQMRGLIITVTAVALVVVALVLVFVLQDRPVEVDMAAIEAEIDEAVEYAKNAPLPTVESALENVFWEG